MATRPLPLIAVFAAAALALSACGGGGTTATNADSAQSATTQPGGGEASPAPDTSQAPAKYASGKTATIALTTDPGNLDPHFTSLGVAYLVDRFLYDTLVNTNPQGKVIPGLATQWKGSNTKVTYTLRDGVKCSDGTTLTASMVAKNINFVGNPKNKSSRIGLFVPPGAKATADNAAGTVTVTSPTPQAFLARSVGGLPIVCPKGMQNRDILKHGASGTGMYTISDVVPDDHYTLTLRKDYAWGPAGFAVSNHPGVPAKVVFKIIPNQATIANLMLAGQVNIAFRMVGPDTKRLSAKGLFESDKSQPLGELWFNEANGHPGSSEAVRRALTQALNLKQLRTTITSGSGRPSKGMVPPGLGPCKPIDVSSLLPDHDPAAAKNTLAGKSVSLKLYYPTSGGPGVQAAAELMQKQWAAAGVQAEIQGASDAQIASVVLAGKGSWDAAIIPIGVNLPSQLVPFLSGPTPPNGQNFASLDNSGYQSHVKDASSTVGDAGCSSWLAAEKSLYQHVDLVLFADTVTPSFGNGATFKLTGGSIAPSSIRMLAE